MSELAAKLERKQVFLPSTDNKEQTEKDWVVIETGRLLGADMLRLDPNDSGGMAHVLAGRIKEWSFTESGEPAAITVENVGRLEIDDLVFLINELGISDQKDESSDPKVTATA